MKHGPQPDNAMQFEHTLMLFFGSKAYQTAGQAATPTSCRYWLRRVLKRLIRDVDKIETTPRHKQLLMQNVEAAHNTIESSNEPTWKFVYHLITLIGRLLGYDYQRGGKCHTLSYWQTYGQNYSAVIQSGGDVLQDYYDELDTVKIRQDVVRSLKKSCLSDFKIALVLHTTEHEVQQLRLGTHRKLRKLKPEGVEE